MIPVPSGVRVWLAVGHTDMRRGMNGLALQVQEALARDPHAGDLYVFRGKRGDRPTLCILPFRGLVAEVSCPLAARGSCWGAD
jgi:transposase